MSNKKNNAFCTHVYFLCDAWVNTMLDGKRLKIGCFFYRERKLLIKGKGDEERLHSNSVVSQWNP